MFLKLVLHGLAADWKVDKDLLMANLASLHLHVSSKEQLETSAPNTSNDSEEDILSGATEKAVPFQHTSSPLSSSDKCYASAESLSMYGQGK